MIPQDTIEKIFDTVRVEEIVGDFVELKKAGVNYKGRCPFHDEKTPSFVVSPTKGIYKCFGCQKGGNSINFIQELQGVSYPEALRYAADKYNIEIEEQELTPEQESRMSAKESQFIATKFASEYFQNVLWNTSEGKAVGLSYFKERGFSEDTIKKFQLGYSPKKQNSFEKAATKAGYDLEILAASSLIGKNEDGKTYDKFRERTIFTIHSYTGKVIGFGGRAFSPDAKSKYLNSGETLIYDKSKVLYGLNLSKQAISKANRCFIVEGYTDVISMHQNGVENVVSASGTALGTQQIQLIKRSTNNVTLLFDGDKAGIKATLRSIDLCLKAEMNVKIASFPDGQDPDSFSKKLSTEEFQEYLEKSGINFVDYLIELYKLNDINDPTQVIEIKKKIIKSISEIPDVFSREEYCKIYHQKLGIEEVKLIAQVNKARSMVVSSPSRNLSPKKEAVKTKKLSRNSEDKLQKQEEEVLRLLLNYGNETFILDEEDESVAAMIINELENDGIEFSTPIHNEIYQEIIAKIEETGKIHIQSFINSNKENISSLAVNLVATPHSISNNWEERHKIYTGLESQKMQKTTKKAILSLKKGVVDFQISELQKAIKEETIDTAGIKKLSELTKIKTQIAKLLGRNIG
ncbi:MAG: DNA primase [Flavobacteriales bacterium]|jgi:DNA primase|nr:DNA primase [Flavobacteriales bacterium]